MAPRRTKSSVKTCDELFSKIVRSRGRCENCGTTENLQCAHGFSRRYKSTRWDGRNAFALCRGCHFYYTVRPIEWDDWLKEKWGSDYQAMRELAQSVARTDFRTLTPFLRDRLKELEAA